MTGTRVVATTAMAQVGEIGRRVHRLTVDRLMSFSSFVAGLAAAGTAVIAIVVVQSAQYGASLAITAIDGAMLLTGMLFVCGSLSGAVGLLSRDLWFRQVLAERERLSILPLGRHALALLALVPTLFPVLVGVCVAVLGIGAFCWGMRTSPITPLAGFGYGLAFSLSVGLVWYVLIRMSGLRSLRVGLLTAMTVGAFAVHAGWTIIDPARLESVPHRWSPMVIALGAEEPFAAWESAGALVVLAVVAWLTVVIGQPPAGHRVRVTAMHVTRPRGKRGRWTTPVSWRVPLGICSTIIRQSSLVSEIGVTIAVCAGAAWITGRMDNLGRMESANATLLVVAAFSALPILGLRSTLGPVYRLWLLGARASDVRRGFLLAAVVTQAPGLSAAVVVLLMTSTSMGMLVLLALLATLAFGLAVLLSNAMRAVTDISVGRAAASAALMAPILLALFTGAVHTDTWIIGVAALAGCVAGLGGLRVTLHERVVS